MPRSQPPSTDPTSLMSDEQVRAHLSGIGRNAFHDWRNDPETGFPPPDMVIRGMNYWERRTVDSFLEAQKAQTSARLESRNAQIKRARSARTGQPAKRTRKAKTPDNGAVSPGNPATGAPATAAVATPFAQNAQIGR